MLMSLPNSTPYYKDSNTSSALESYARSQSTLEMLSSHNMRMAEADETEIQKQIDEIITNSKQELRYRRIRCLVFAILAILTCALVKLAGSLIYMDSDHKDDENEKDQDYFLPYEWVGLGPHFVFSFYIMYLIARNFETQMMCNYSSKITGIVLIINALLVASQILVVYLLFNQRDKCNKLSVCSDDYGTYIVKFLLITGLADSVMFLSSMMIHRYQKCLYLKQRIIDGLIDEQEAEFKRKKQLAEQMIEVSINMSQNSHQNYMMGLAGRPNFNLGTYDGSDSQSTMRGL